jgi:hypothetical protein
MIKINKFPVIQRIKALIFSSKVLLLLFVLVICINNAAAQNSVGKLGTWTFKRVSSREKYDEVLPVSYKMRTSRHKNFDRIVFEFDERDVPEYTVYYKNAPILIDRSHIENPAKPTKEETINVKGKAFVIIDFALGFAGIDVRSPSMGEQDLPVVRDIKTVDWFENFFSFAVGLKAKKAFRVRELSNPTRLVIDFKH